MNSFKPSKVMPIFFAYSERRAGAASVHTPPEGYTYDKTIPPSWNRLLLPTFYKSRSAGEGTQPKYSNVGYFEPHLYT